MKIFVGVLGAILEPCSHGMTVHIFLGSGDFGAGGGSAMGLAGGALFFGEGGCVGPSAIGLVKVAEAGE
jgi:hypothetical protein